MDATRTRVVTLSIGDVSKLLFDEAVRRLGLTPQSVVTQTNTWSLSGSGEVLSVEVVLTEKVP